VHAGESPCYVISDIHLGAHNAPAEHTLLALLAHARDHARSLVINGDLFDFWFEWRTVIPRLAFRTLAALADLRARGVDILWIAGNHDCWGGDVLRRDVGVDYQAGPWAGTIAGWRALIEHGDGLRGREDLRYRVIRPVLRNRLAIAAFRWVHPDIATRLAAGSSHASRTTRAKDGGAGLRAVALERLASNPDLDLVIFGHSHVPALERAPGGGVYANSGSWLESPTYLRVTTKRVELRAWDPRADGSPEGHCLDAFDRRSEKTLSSAQELLGGVAGNETGRRAR